MVISRVTATFAFLLATLLLLAQIFSPRCFSKLPLVVLSITRFARFTSRHHVFAKFKQLRQHAPPIVARCHRWNSFLLVHAIRAIFSASFESFLRCGNLAEGVLGL